MVYFEWDIRKERENLRKHGLGFEAASKVFEDPFLLIEFDRLVDGEERLHGLGRSGESAVLLVVHLVEHEGKDVWCRIISARRADRSERKRYEENRAENSWNTFE